ncbi:MAG: hypothetical protein CUN54_09475, partial [Phototrophicales bacterium]
MKTSKKLNGGVLLILLATTIGGIIAISSVNSLSELLDQITGPVWDTADGAMEGSIGIEAEMLVVGSVIAGDRTMVEAETPLDASRAMADQALGRMQAAGLIEANEIERLEQNVKAFRTLEKQVLRLNDDYLNANQKLTAQFQSFQSFMIGIEEYGDGAVEQFAANPNRQISWSQGLSEYWQAADGGMETQIALLTLYYQYESLVS